MQTIHVSMNAHWQRQLHDMHQNENSGHLSWHTVQSILYAPRSCSLWCVGGHGVGWWRSLLSTLQVNTVLKHCLGLYLNCHMHHSKRSVEYFKLVCKYDMTGLCSYCQHKKGQSLCAVFSTSDRPFKAPTQMGKAGDKKPSMCWCVAVEFEWFDEVYHSLQKETSLRAAGLMDKDIKTDNGSCIPYV